MQYLGCTEMALHTEQRVADTDAWYGSAGAQWSADAPSTGDALASDAWPRDAEWWLAAS